MTENFLRPQFAQYVPRAVQDAGISPKLFTGFSLIRCIHNVLQDRHGFGDRDGMITNFALRRLLGSIVTATSIAAFSALTIQTVSADIIPTQESREFKGMYKVASSTDPIFPMNANEEWFLDFGKGIHDGVFSGSVAVSLRRNPEVKVRIMAWQYFPQNARLLLGNTYSEASNKAVAKGSWTMDATSQGITFQRGNYLVVLHRADPGDY